MNRMELASRLAKIAKTMVGASDHKQWAEILDIIKKTNRFGEEEMVDFMAEVWNGGLEQWVTHGKADQLHVVIGLAKKMGHAGQEMARILYGLKGEIEDFDNIKSKPFSEYEQEDYDSATEPLDEFDDWFYKNDEKFQQEFFEYLTKDAAKAASVKASKRTAGVWALPRSSSDVVKIVRLVKTLKAGEWPKSNPVDDALGSILGEEALLDKLDNAGEEYLKKCADAIVKSVEKMAKEPEDSFTDNREYQALQVLRDSLK